MNLEELKQTLNAHQYQAVTLKANKNALIIAGAGSGKTRVLTYRIAYLCSKQIANPEQILALTFTNKAAREMKERLQMLMTIPITSMWIGTFHALVYRILVENKTKGEPTWQLLDAQDQLRLIKRLMLSLNLDEKNFIPQKIRHFINMQKEEGKRAGELTSNSNFVIKKYTQVYLAYEQYTKKNFLLDFAELLLRCYELLKKHDALRIKYQKQFSYIFVDEFQDTNQIQYRWLKLLHHTKNYLFCVGDDDQSIYGWRGAKIEHMQNIKTDISDIELIRLEQNYRSTGHILSAANTLISHNKNRLGKKLWTESGDGDVIDIFLVSDEKKEVRMVADMIENYLHHSVSAKDCAILYRTNAQSRLVEEELIGRSIPYEVYGGLRFFERAEIKNAISYLRLLVHLDDNYAFLRIVNFPPRGIGRNTLGCIELNSAQNNISLWQSMCEIKHTFNTRTQNALNSFFDLITNLIVETQNLDLENTLRRIIKKSTLITYYEKSINELDKNRVQNLNELIGAAKQYEAQTDNLHVKQAFIERAALDEVQHNKKNRPSVQLMTVHSAKGLEFPYVFVIGMEDGIFPSAQAQEKAKDLDEERRLCYVAITRAMKKLHLSCAHKRFLWGQTLMLPPSRFLSELPSKHLNIVYKNKDVYQNKHFGNHTLNKSMPYKIGDTVKHTKFGIGTVINCEGSGESTRVQINFKDTDTKWIIIAYANLSKI